jgi:Peptidase family M23
MMNFHLAMPVKTGRITQHFGEHPENYEGFGLPGHEGIDFGVPEGTQIFACADGVVSRVQLDGNTDRKGRPYGNQVRIRHTNDEGIFETVYAHLSQALVAPDNTIRAGELIGLSGNTGNSSGPHLHLTLKKQGATARGETRFPNDIMDPAPFLDTSLAPSTSGSMGMTAPTPPQRVKKPDYPLRGLHGDEAANWMRNNGVRGWATEVIYSGGDLATPKPCDYTAHEQAGIRVIVRWNYSFAKSDGGLGTFPTRDLYNDFARWCAQSIKLSRGVWGHIIGNEPNRPGERPDYQNEANQGTPITPDDIATIYNMVYRALPKETRVSPPAIDPTNAQTAKPLDYWRGIVKKIAGAEFFALHSYSFGSNQPVDSADIFQHMPEQFHSFRMWEKQAEIISKAGYVRVPLIITETNHLYLTDGQTTGWESNAGGWISNVYDYVRRWNAEPGSQYVHGICMYRFRGDAWAIENIPELLRALRDSGEQPI